MNTRVRDKFFQTIEAHEMLQPGDRVLVCVSGGADSVCLLYLMHEARQALGITVDAAHVNHGIRGEEGDRDEAFVRSFCAAREIPLHVLKADIPAEAEKTGESLELCARRIRYAYFESLPFDKIATAHTGSDNAETFLMRLSRGTALRGLCAIPPKRGNIIRPLLDCFRYEIEEFCKANRFSYVSDSTNESDDFTRNRIRRRVIPALREENPAVEEAMTRCIGALRRDDDFLSQVANEQFTSCLCEGKAALSAEKLVRLHPALRYRVLAMYISAYSDSDFEEKHLSALDQHLQDETYALFLPSGRRIAIRKGLIAFADADDPESKTISAVSVSVGREDSAVFDATRFRFKIEKTSGACSFSINDVDLSKIGSRLMIRTRQPGDRMRPYRRGCSKTMKQLFSEAGIPPEKRDRVPLIADEKGVIWVFGFGVDENRRPGTDTTEIFRIETEDLPQ